MFKQLECFHNFPDTVLCVTKAEVFDSMTNKVIAIAPRNSINKISDLDPIKLAFHLGEVGPSFLLKREALPNGFYNNQIPNVSDFVLWVEIIMKGPVKMVDEVLVRYRRHDNNLSSNFEKVNFEHLLGLLYLDSRYPELKDIVQNKKYKIFKNLIMSQQLYMRRFLKNYSLKQLFYEMVRRLIKRLNIS